jgi:hypothetical protein
MTRQEFIERDQTLKKTVEKSALRWVVSGLIVTVAVFAYIAYLKPPPRDWRTGGLLIGLLILWIGGMLWAMRSYRRKIICLQLQCPTCKSLFVNRWEVHTVIATGRCGFCGGTVLNDD